MGSALTPSRADRHQPDLYSPPEFRLGGFSLSGLQSTVSTPQTSRPTPAQTFVKPYEKNARVISPKAVEKVAASIKEFGWRQPIVVDSEGVIVVGHVRLLGAPNHVAAPLRSCPTSSKVWPVDSKIGGVPVKSINRRQITSTYRGSISIKAAMRSLR